MASGTVTRVLETQLNPKIETVFLNVNNAETYTSRKFHNIEAASVSSNTASVGSVAATFSGTEAAIYLGGGATKVDCTLVLYGE